MTNQNYPSAILQELHLLQHKAILTDVNITIDSQTFSAHRSVLAASSIFFRTMFTSSFLEADSSNIHLIGFSATTFSKLLHYIYSGHLAIAPETACETLNLALFLDCTTAIDLTSEYILTTMDQIPADDLLEIICLCEHRNDLKFLLLPAMNILATKFLELAASEIFIQHLPSHILTHIIQCECVESTTTTEQQVSVLKTSFIIFIFIRIIVLWCDFKTMYLSPVLPLSCK